MRGRLICSRWWRQGLRRLGHPEAAEQSIHLSYEIVALTPRCAAEMGYELGPEEDQEALRGGERAEGARALRPTI